jgi:serine/threonine-protein kinase
MTSGRPDGDPSLDAAAAVFAEFLERRDRGEDVDLGAVCAEHPELAEELRRLGSNWERLGEVLEAAPEPAPEEVLRRFGAGAGQDERYAIRGEVGRGGMGAVLRVWEADLRRELAMKVILSPDGRVEPRRLSRFLEEARITGRLEHPGIVPVHELGVDAEGRVFFTMQLVPAELARASARTGRPPDFVHYSLGVRPARAIE